MTNEAIVFFLYLYIIQETSQEDFLQFCLFEKKFVNKC